MGKIQINNNIGAQPTSLTQNVETNWKNRKVQVIGSGASSVALGAGIAIANLLGGPIAAIIALAAAAFATLGILVTSLLAKPRAVTSQPQEEKVEQTVSQKIAEKMAIVQPVQPPVAPKQGLLNQALSYAKEHPYRTALGAAALTAGASAGLCALGAFSSGFTGTLVPVATTSATLTAGKVSLLAAPLSASTLFWIPASTFKSFSAPGYENFIASNVLNAQQNTAAMKGSTNQILATFAKVSKLIDLKAV